MRVAPFITCFNDMMFPGTGRAVTGLLEGLGHTVEFPQGQTCCGQMHSNAGCRPETLPMVFRGGCRGLRRRGPPSGTCAGRVITLPGPAAARYGRYRVVTDGRRVAAVLVLLASDPSGGAFKDPATLFIRPIRALTSNISTA